jgi:PKD repeat protein
VNNVDPTASIAMTQPNPQFILPIVHTLTFDGSSEDPGSDDLTFEWDFDDGTVVTTTYYNNDPINTTDPYPSPDVNPMDVTDTQTHIYASPGTYIVSLPVTDDDSGVGSGTHTVIVFTAEEAKHDINGYIQGLPDSYFKGNANQRKNAYNNMLMAIDDMLIDEEYQGAIRDLQNNIRPKSDTDCAVNDGNSKNDWIIDPEAQEHICMKIDDLTAYLEYLKTL